VTVAGDERLVWRVDIDATTRVSAWSYGTALRIHLETFNATGEGDATFFELTETQWHGLARALARRIVRK
jgi:hypothetical protein